MQFCMRAASLNKSTVWTKCNSPHRSSDWLLLISLQQCHSFCIFITTGLIKKWLGISQFELLFEVCSLKRELSTLRASLENLEKDKYKRCNSSPHIVHTIIINSQEDFQFLWPAFSSQLGHFSVKKMLQNILSSTVQKIKVRLAQ